MDYRVAVLNTYNDLNDKHKYIKSLFAKGINNGSFFSDCIIYLAITERESGILIHSTSYLTRANDLMNYLSGRLSILSTLALVEEQNSPDGIESCCIYRGEIIDDLERSTDIVHQIEIVMEDYDSNTVIIDARFFYEEQKDNISRWSQYKAMNQPKCYVPMKSFKQFLRLEDSEDVLIRTLENVTGVTLKATDNKIIMIGVNGETYDMSYEKFDELYQRIEPNEFGIDVSEISSGYELKPKAIIRNSEEIDLLKFAEICQSRKNRIVYACLMKKNIKVFSTRVTGTNQYYFGNGEKKPFYLTVDKDSTTSVHVVDRDIFERSYELVNI